MVYYGTNVESSRPSGPGYIGSAVGYSRLETSIARSAAYGGSSAVSIGSNGAYGGAGHAPDAGLYAHAGSGGASLEEALNMPRENKLTKMVESLYVPSSARGAYMSAQTQSENFIASNFLTSNSTARFVGSAAEIQDDIKQAFKTTTGEDLPDDIQITVLDNAEFTKVHLEHAGASSDGVQGFSLNSNGQGTNQVFVRANPLDRLMLTIGHEIGHVLTPTLQDQHDEEAKAFAFSLAWMNAIKEDNIAGIGSNVLPEPAENGLHDKAFSFVQWLVDSGTRAWDAFLQLARGEVTIQRKPIIIEV